ncbi:hypothetical protein K3495_g1095 [Podosphaera aphanis]|nr:hypothetical protein K3495_g1095 [Podosphaera aphanis]
MSGSNRKKRQTPQALTNLKNGTGSIGGAISRPKQVEHWPLDFQEEKALDRRAHETLVPSKSEKRVAPKRPPRPSYVPSILDPTKTQASTPSSQDPSQKFVADGKGFTSPSLYTTSSRPSSYASSSVGTIPDFPIPTGNRLSQRGTNLPASFSLARNTSIQYPHKSSISPITPIPEEPLRSGKPYSAYASSSAMPTGWRSVDSPDFSQTSNNSKGKQFTPYIPEKAKLNETERWTDYDRNTNERDYDDNTDYGDYDTENDEQQLNSTFGPPKENFRNSSKSTIDGIRFSRKTSLSEEKRPARSSKTSFSIQEKKHRDSRGTNYDNLSLASAAEPIGTKNGEIDGSLLYLPDNSAPRSTSPPRNSIFPRFTTRFNPQTDPMADSRWSSTSLPDLILRATRLASLIDRGKRPGSNVYDNYNCEKGVENGNYEQDQIHPPQLDTSDAAARFSPTEPARQSEVGHSDSLPTTPSTRQRKVRPQKYCCLPYRVFIALLTLPVIIILAAVFVPLTLFVFTKQRSVTIPSRIDALNSCAMSSITSCQNGGSSILLEDDSCGCLCTNGFDGRTCTTSITSLGCINSTIAGEPESMGSSIERLIIDAKSNFSIPLDTRMILSRFNTANISCAAENSLVTFNGRSFRIDYPNIPLENIRSPRKIRNDVDPTPNLRIEIFSDSSLDLRDTLPSAAQPTSTTAITDSPTPITPEPDPPKFSPNEVTLDFARVATLYILQETSLREAIDAQTSFQRFFNGLSFLADSAQNFTLSSSGKQITVNIVMGSLDLGSGGGVVGGKGGRRDTSNALGLGLERVKDAG